MHVGPFILYTQMCLDASFSGLTPTIEPIVNKNQDLVIALRSGKVLLPLYSEVQWEWAL